MAFQPPLFIVFQLEEAVCHYYLGAKRVNNIVASATWLRVYRRDREQDSLRWNFRASYAIALFRAKIGRRPKAKSHQSSRSSRSKHAMFRLATVVDFQNTFHMGAAFIGGYHVIASVIVVCAMVVDGW